MGILRSHVPDASRALPEFPDIDLQGKPLPDGVELEHIKSFQVLYREHCEVTYERIVSVWSVKHVVKSQITVEMSLWRIYMCPVLFSLCLIRLYWM